MDRWQFSIRGVLIGFVVLATALAGMTIGSPWIASAVYTLEVLLLAVAVCGVTLGEPRTRAFWVGWLAFGMIYVLAMGTGALLVPTVAGQTTRPRLITEPLVEYLGQFSLPKPALGQVVQAQWTNGGYYAGKVTQIVNGQYEITWLDGSAPIFVALPQIKDNPTTFQTQSHLVLGLLLAWAGGIFALRMFGPHPIPAVARAKQPAKSEELEIDQNKKSPAEVFGARPSASTEHAASAGNGQTPSHTVTPEVIV